MGKVNDGVLRNFNNGDIVDEASFEREFEILRVAGNDTHDRTVTNAGGISALDTRTTALESDNETNKTNITNHETRVATLESLGLGVEADFAQTQGTYAKAQGDYAKAEADRLVGTDVSVLETRVTDHDTQLADIAINITQFDHLKVAIGATGQYDYAPVIQATIDYVASLGGGTVLIPKGTFYVLGKAKTIYLSSNVNIKGAGKNVSVIKIHESTGDWGQLLRSRTEAMHDIEISNLTLDCNINNIVGYPERWGDNNRVLLYLGEGYRYNIHDVKLVTNGVWGIRGKISYSTIKNVEAEFDVTTYTGTAFDVSCFWLGGEENFITNNKIKVVEGSTFIPPTAIECQGHRNHYSGNTLKGFSVGFIFTSSTSYENIYHVISELGANDNKIYNNIIVSRDGGIIIWTMNVPVGSFINNLTIHDNTIDVIKGASTTRSVGIGMRLGNPYSTTPSDQDMTAPLRNCKIYNNLIKFDTRKVNISPSAGDHGFRFECDVEIDGLEIYDNTLINVGGMGVWLNENEMRDPSTNAVMNNEWIKNVKIKGNWFKEVKLGIRLSRNVSDVIIEDNTFEQKAIYPTFSDNMIFAIQAENTTYTSNKNYKILNNKFVGADGLKPFYPTQYLPSIIYTHFSPARGMLLEQNTQEIYDEKPSGIGVPVNNTQHVRMLDGTKKKTTYGIGSTIGTLKTSGGASVTITSSVDANTFIVNDATNIRPSHHLLLDNTKFNTDIVVVLAVVGNTVYVAQDAGLKAGAVLPSTINYFANLVTA